MNNKSFWLVPNIGLSLFYLWALSLLLTGHAGHWAVIVSAIILAVHVLEIPFVFKKLSAHNPNRMRLVLGTLLFGFTWWLPASRGIYQTG